MSVADPLASAIGLVSGFATAIAVGYLIFKAAIRIDLSTFFTYTGIALIVVAAGVLAYGVHEFQELGYLPGGESYVFDVSALLGKETLIGAILAGTVGFDASTSWLQLGVYALYIVTVLRLYLVKASTKAPAHA